MIMNYVHSPYVLVNVRDINLHILCVYAKIMKVHLIRHNKCTLFIILMRIHS